MNQPIISADGSDRKFHRVLFKGRNAVSIAPPDSEIGLKEARSFFNIGRHLFDAGLPVPELYDFNEITGTVIVEDLGDLLLYDVIGNFQKQKQHDDISGIYQDAVMLLHDFQIRGSAGFDISWCFDTCCYNGRFAWEREASYFLNSFLHDHLGIKPPPELIDELRGLCERVDRLYHESCFLHRDFQSRNIMLYQGALKVIDFQGARLGPWGYDLASLLYDPYVSLSEDVRLELFDFYLDTSSAHAFPPFTSEPLSAFFVAALLRTLQALGAFSFLSVKKKRKFFTCFIVPAVRNLMTLLEKECFKDMHAMHALVSTLVDSVRDIPSTNAAKHPQ